MTVRVGAQQGRIQQDFQGVLLMASNPLCYGQQINKNNALCLVNI